MNGAGGIRLFSTLAMVVCFAGVLRAVELRAKVDVACQPTGKPLQYDCTIRLLHARSNEPLSDVVLTVGADMPSMPLAHNVRPVKATLGTAPGMHEVRIELEMLGDWALRIDLTGRVRDRVIKVLRFEQDRVGPATAPGNPPSQHKH